MASVIETRDMMRSTQKERSHDVRRRRRDGKRNSGICKTEQLTNLLFVALYYIRNSETVGMSKLPNRQIDM